MTKVFVIIVNFNSDQKVKELAEKVAGYKVVGGVVVVNNNPTNIGFAAAVNQGIRITLEKKAETVLLVNPDVTIGEREIEKLVANKNDIVSPILTFTRGEQKVFDYGGRVNWIIGRTSHKETDSIASLQNDGGKIDFVSGACMLIHKNVFAKIGYFDDRFFLYFEDVDFCHRAKLAGFSVAVDSKVVVPHQISEHKNTKDKFKLQQILHSNFLFINKWLPWYFKPFGYFYLALLSVLILVK